MSPRPDRQTSTFEPCGSGRVSSLAARATPLGAFVEHVKDCKSVEELVNLQDFLETQFDGYLRKERDAFWRWDS